MLEKRGIPLAKAREIANFETHALFTPRERAALAYANGVTKYDIGVDERLYARVKDQFTDDEIVELTALIAYQNLSSKFNAALDVPAQGFCEMPSKL